MINVLEISRKTVPIDSKLYEDIKENGLRFPIIVKRSNGERKYKIIDGQQRLLIFEKLGRTTIQATIII